jgi:hypothetical protein
MVHNQQWITEWPTGLDYWTAAARNLRATLAAEYPLVLNPMNLTDIRLTQAAGIAAKTLIFRV